MKDSPLQPRTRSITEIADLLGVSYGHIWKLVKDGEIRSLRLGGRILIPVEEVDRLLAAAA